MNVTSDRLAEELQPGLKLFKRRIQSMGLGTGHPRDPLILPKLGVEPFAVTHRPSRHPWAVTSGDVVERNGDAMGFGHQIVKFRSIPGHRGTAGLNYECARHSGQNDGRCGQSAAPDGDLIPLS